MIVDFNPRYWKALLFFMQQTWHNSLSSLPSELAQVHSSKSYFSQIEPAHCWGKCKFYLISVESKLLSTVTGRYKFQMSNNKVGIFNVINNRARDESPWQTTAGAYKVLGLIPGTTKQKHRWLSEPIISHKYTWDWMKVSCATFKSIKGKKKKTKQKQRKRPFHICVGYCDSSTSRKKNKFSLRRKSDI